MIFHIGILGGGNITQPHARAAQEINDAKIVAFCCQNADKVRRRAETFGGRGYEDLEAFLNHRPMDAVLIGSPSGLHAEQAIAAARRGLHVLIEKPIAVATKQTDAVIEACEK